jgi:hypothetical protein
MRDWFGGDAEEREALEAAEAAGVLIDDQAQFRTLLPLLRPQETLRAVLDMKGGGTGFLGITDKRLIVYDQAFFGERRAMVSIPFGKVTRVASEDNQAGPFGVQWSWEVNSSLTIFVGSESYEFAFRGADKAHRAYELIIDAIL